MSNPYFQTSFYFTLQIGLNLGLDAAFQEVSGLVAEMAVEEVVSGGQNMFKYRLPGMTHYQNLVLKRGIAFNYSPLIVWCQSTLNGGLAQPIVPQDVLLTMLDPSGFPSMVWSFVNAYPVKWSVADLKSTEGAVAIETVELAYQYFTVLDPRSSVATALAAGVAANAAATIAALGAL